MYKAWENTSVVVSAAYPFCLTCLYSCSHDCASITSVIVVPSSWLSYTRLDKAPLG
jgi:hypothetical protein